MKATIVTPDIKRPFEVLDLGKPLTLEEMQLLVGGYIEVVPPTEHMTQRGETLVVNEEGLLLKLPYNPLASAIARRELVGTALLLDYELP